MTSKASIKYSLPPLTMSDQDYQEHLQKNKFQFRILKHRNSQVKVGRIHLKTFPGPKTNQLNHYVIPTLDEFDYDCAIIHVGINDILRSKDISELKDLPKKIMQIGTTC